MCRFVRNCDKSRWSNVKILGFVFIFCLAGVQAAISNDKQQRAASPEIQSYLAALQKEIDEGGYTFKVGNNPAMKYSIEQLCGLVQPKGWRTRALFEETETYLTELPKAFDWRDNGGNTPVRNQGGCGSCWAFATVSVLENAIKRNCGDIEDLSEQYLVSCNVDGWSCNGGWFAHDYHQWKIPKSKGETDFGAVLEVDFPYMAKDVPCNGPHQHPFKIDNWKFVGGGGSVPSVSALKQAIYNYGPVAAAVCVGSRFQAYKSGIFNYDEKCSGTVNHAITLVGWNDDLGTDNGYWILKNSWGEGWGEQGYMRIRYNTSKVGFAANYIELSDCGDSPEQLDCSGAITLDLDATVTGSTIAATNNVNAYSCTNNESGPEVVYKVTTSKAGRLVATLSDLGSNLDVFILRSCNPQDCVAFGDVQATLANAPAGTYYVVVDGRNGAAGSFSLNLSLISTVPELTGQWTSLKSSSRGRRVSGTLKVMNTGSASAGPFKVAYYLSSSIYPSGNPIAVDTISSLDINTYRNLSRTFSWWVSKSKKYLVAYIDYQGAVPEQNEANNIVAVQIP